MRAQLATPETFRRTDEKIISVSKSFHPHSVFLLLAVYLIGRPNQVVAPIFISKLEVAGTVLLVLTIFILLLSHQNSNYSFKSFLTMLWFCKHNVWAYI